MAVVTTENNLIPQFKRNWEEGTVCGWAVPTNSNVFASDNFAYDGTRSLKVTRLNTVGTAEARYVAAATIAQTPPSINSGIPVKANKSYTLMAWILCEDAFSLGHTGRFGEIEFYNSSGTLVTTIATTTADRKRIGDDKWYFVYYNFTVPNNSTIRLMRFSIWFESAPVNSQHYIDYPQLYEGTLVTQPLPPAPAYYGTPAASFSRSVLQELNFITTSLLTGQVVAEVELSSFSYNEILNRPGNGSATARIEAETTTEENFLSWGNALWCLENGNILWGGIIGDTQPRADSRVINIPLYGFMEYYKTQPIQTTVPPSTAVTFPPNSQWDYGLSYGGHAHKSAVVFQTVDQFNIFEDLINHVAKRDLLSDIKPVVYYDDLSGVLRDQTYYNYEYKMVATACEQLADKENGFFWATRFTFDFNSPTFAFYLNSNLDGEHRPIILDWDDTEESTALNSYDFTGYKKPANSVIALGEGEGPASLVSRKESKYDAFGAYTGGRPRYYEVLSYKDIKSQSTLNSHTSKYWSRHKIPFRSATVKMQNPEQEYMSFEMGDTLTLQVLDHGLRYLNKYRAVNRSVVFTKEGDKQVTLELQEPFVYLEGDSI